jgi:prevent-host-death family protein
MQLREPDMKTFNLADAKARLSRLVDRAAAGETIVIAKNGRPLAKLVPIRGRAHGAKYGTLKKYMSQKDIDALVAAVEVGLPPEALASFHASEIEQ